jgi:ADP-heptose:LPS heptosyltransferase
LQNGEQASSRGIAMVSSLIIPHSTLGRPIAVLVDREGLGDALLKVPFLRAVARGFPGQPVWWIARHQTAMAGPLRSFLPGALAEVREQVGLGGSWHDVRRELRGFPAFSLVFDMRTRIASIWRARRYLTWDRFLCCLPAYLLSGARPPGRLTRPRHIGERALSLVEAALGAPADPSGELACTPKAMATARSILPDGPVYVGLAVGSREARKNWPLDRFITLAEGLAESGFVPVLLLGPQESDCARELRYAASHLPLVDFMRFPTELNRLDAAIALAGRLTVVVANDSGMGHLFGAAGRPVVSLFGPTDPRRWAPFAPIQRTLRAQDFGGHAMELIQPEAVLHAIKETIAATKNPSMISAEGARI